MLSFETLKVVELRTPFHLLADPQVRDFFGQVLELKLMGYRGRYPDGVIPVDTTDFVANHLLVCEEQEGELIPLMGYKTVTLRRCKVHNLTFPALSLLSSSNAPAQHKQATQAILDRCEEKGIDVSYDSSWTIAPKVRENRELTLELRNILTSIVTHYHDEYRIPEIMGLGVVKLKTAKLFATWGLHPILFNGEPLPTFTLASLQGAEVVLVHGMPFSEEAKALAERYSKYWADRLTIAAPAAADTIKKAA